MWFSSFRFPHQNHPYFLFPPPPHVPDTTPTSSLLAHAASVKLKLSGRYKIKGYFVRKLVGYLGY